MPENPLKMPRSASPVARAGAGDISERELSRERHKLQVTPPARLQPTHPKKQLFLTPVNKFTASYRGHTPNLDKIRHCLEEYITPVKRAKMTKKASSMEDLTPTKRQKNNVDSNPKSALVVRELGFHGIAEEQAALRVARFMVVAAWRRRRGEVRCLRKTLEFQVSCSERLRLQVCALKSLLDADNGKVRLAMRELERLKQLLRDKERERAVLEREKLALEDDVCTAEDRASEMGINWRNARNETELARGAVMAAERALALERAAGAEARAQRDHAYGRLSLIEEDMAQQEELLSGAETESAALRYELEATRGDLEDAAADLRGEREAREAISLERASLQSSLAAAEASTAELRESLGALHAQLADTSARLADTRAQLEWWPAPLTRLVGAARRWLRPPSSAPAALLWRVLPAHAGAQLASATYML